MYTEGYSKLVLWLGTLFFVCFLLWDEVVVGGLTVLIISLNFFFKGNKKKERGKLSYEEPQPWTQTSQLQKFKRYKSIQ